MVKDIVKDEMFLRIPSVIATADDAFVATDLIDTLKANEERCVGLAANMIGVSKRIIVVDNDGEPLVMFNPEIISCKEPFETEEACLSLIGNRKTRRFKSVKVKYQNSDFQVRIKKFEGFTAQIIQHEIDHCNGIIV